MKTTMTILAGLLLSTSIHAANLCSKYETYPRYMKAIEAVATSQGYTLEQFCTLKRVWDVEAQPSRIINSKGEIIPHVRVQQHFEFDSCLFLVNETDYSITKTSCYSGT